MNPKLWNPVIIIQKAWDSRRDGWRPEGPSIETVSCLCHWALEAPVNDWARPTNKQIPGQSLTQWQRQEKLPAPSIFDASRRLLVREVKRWNDLWSGTSCLSTFLERKLVAVGIFRFYYFFSFPHHQIHIGEEIILLETEDTSLRSASRPEGRPPESWNINNRGKNRIFHLVFVFPGRWKILFPPAGGYRDYFQDSTAFGPIANRDRSENKNISFRV